MGTVQDSAGSAFYRTTRGAMGTSLGMQGCLNQGNNYGYVARVRDLGVAKHRLNSAGVQSSRRSNSSA